MSVALALPCLGQMTRAVYFDQDSRLEAATPLNHKSKYKAATSLALQPPHTHPATTHMHSQTLVCHSVYMDIG